MPKPTPVLLQREGLEVGGLARPDADARKLGAYFLLVLLSGRELQREIEVVEEIGFHQFFVDFRE